MLQSLWNKFKAYQTYAQTKTRAQGTFRKYDEAEATVKKLASLEADAAKEVARAHIRCQASKPNERVRIDPDRISGPELALLEAVARHVNVRNNLAQALSTLQGKVDELQPGLSWMKAQMALPGLQYDGTKQAGLISYIETFEPYIEKLLVACEVERRLLAWLPTQGPESVIKRFSDNSAWFYASLEGLVPPPLPDQTNKGKEQSTARTKDANSNEASDDIETNLTAPRAPRIKRTSPAKPEAEPTATESPIPAAPEAPAESERATTASTETTAGAQGAAGISESTEEQAKTSASVTSPKPTPAPPAAPILPTPPPWIQGEAAEASFAEMMDEVRKSTVRHESALVYLGVLSETQKRLEDEIRARNSKWLFEKRLGLMRGIEVENLENAAVFAAEVRKLGLATAYDLIAAAAKGPIAVGLTVSDVQLSRSTNLKYEIAMAAMSAVKEALDETRDSLRLRLDPDAINTEEKFLLEDVARYINVTNDLPVVMDKMRAKLACFTDCVSKARSRSANPSLMSNGTARTELAEYCKTVTASLERFITDCNEHGAALLALPSEGPMEVVRRFSDNSAWFYATLAAVVSPAKSKDPVDKRGFTPSGGRHGTGVRRPHGTDTRDLDRDKTDDSDRPKLRPPPDSSFVPYDWGATEDQDELRQTREAEALETEFHPLPDSSEDTDHGHVPLEIAQAVEALELKRGVLKATLRRYQMFGAQFMIQQQRTLLGDDMGLGKTVQSLAAMCHLHALGQRHFLVVAPNSVLINWEREVTTHTGLRPFVLHGTQRLANCAEWSKSGGVGITTYDTAGVLLPHIANIDMLVVDEAHKIKNPKAKRTQRITLAASKAPIVALMSGTALENRLSELHALVCLAQPEIKAAADYLLSSARPSAEEARRRIAAAYLRRTQADVLSELPEMTKVDEYVSLSEDERNTEEAMKPHVQNQRIATTIGTGDGNSAKYERLKELLEFYRANGDKVVIFSAFRQVLEDVSKICGGCDQITGEVSPSKRMGMIDRLKAKTGFGCLALQVDAGGQGLNIQFARVVILMEPQFKPSTESQAIARVYRMGQGRKVIVHRLIAKDSIDEDLVELIKYKQQIFDDYAHHSAVKDESTQSTDSSTVQAEIMDELKRKIADRLQRRPQTGAGEASGS